MARKHQNPDVTITIPLDALDDAHAALLWRSEYNKGPKHDGSMHCSCPVAGALRDALGWGEADHRGSLAK